MKKMKNNTVVRNNVHLDDEIDTSSLEGLEGMQVDVIKLQVGPFGFFDVPPHIQKSVDQLQLETRNSFPSVRSGRRVREVLVVDVAIVGQNTA